MINDSEFINRFSVELGAEYRLAKSYVREMPSQALVHVRSLCHCLVKQLSISHFVTFSSPNLYDRVEQLNTLKAITPRQTRLLHKLRVQGNKGAHPEKYHLTLSQLVLLAEKAIADLLLLVSSLQSIKAEQAYRFEPFDDLLGRDLCYKAVMEADPHAQYLVGMSLKSKGLMLLEQEQANENEVSDANEILMQAGYWFAQAVEKEPKARFEHGVALIHGYCGEIQLAQGEEAVAQAAEAGDVEAIALQGYFYLSGSHTFEIDLDKAFGLLQRAAEHDHPEAMANLGVYYYQLNDEKSAFMWINKAAQAGNPHSQYHLALMLEAGEGCTANLRQSQVWYEEAAKQVQLDAMLAMASKMLAKESLSEAESQITQDYLADVIKYAHSVPAMLELSVALADGVLGRIDIVESADLLRKAKVYANARELEIIQPLWDSMLVQIDQVLALTENNQQQITLKQARKILQPE